MADEVYQFRLIACRELMDSHPESLVIRQQVEALEEVRAALPPGLVRLARAETDDPVIVETWM